MSSFKMELVGDNKAPEKINGILRCYAFEDGSIGPNSRGLISVGFKLEIPNDYFAYVFGQNVKSLGGVGDSDYRGVYNVIACNKNSSEMVYKKGDYVGNICFPKIRTPALQVVTE